MKTIPDNMIDRLNNLGLPDSPEVRRIIKLFLSMPNAILVSKDLPNNQFLVEIITPPQDTTQNGTNSPDSK